jgi:alpha-L-fucosidase
MSAQDVASAALKTRFFYHPLLPPIKVSNFTLANTPWRGGGVDLMVEYVKTAAKHGVSPGVFYSAHFNWYYGVVGFETGHYAMSGLNLTQEQYNENVTRPQLLELLKSYGNLSEIWFDGGLNNTINHVPAEVINSLSPRQACHSCDGASQDARDPAVGYGIRWVGNEEGTTPQPNWLTANNPSQGPGTASGIYFAPPSCDTVLREHLWFWANNTESRLRSVETLVNVYLTSVGQGCNLILNMAPDPTGHLPDVDARQYQAMGEAVACLFQQVVANSSTFSTTGGVLPSITWQVPSASTASHISIALWEDLTQGQLINAWVLQARAPAGDWVTLESGQTITHKRILHNMTMPASVLPLSALRLNVTSTLAQPDQEPKLRRAELFDMSGRASCVGAR